MTLYDQLPALVVAVLLFTAPITYMLRLHGFPWFSAMAAVVVSFFVACSLAATTMSGETIIYEMGGWPAPYGIVLHIDALSALMAMLITALRLTDMSPDPMMMPVTAHRHCRSAVVWATIRWKAVTATMNCTAAMATTF